MNNLGAHSITDILSYLPQKKKKPADGVPQPDAASPTSATLPPSASTPYHPAPNGHAASPRLNGVPTPSPRPVSKSPYPTNTTNHRPQAQSTPQPSKIRKDRGDEGTPNPNNTNRPHKKRKTVSFCVDVVDETGRSSSFVLDFRMVRPRLAIRTMGCNLCSKPRRPSPRFNKATKRGLVSFLNRTFRRDPFVPDWENRRVMSAAPSPSGRTLFLSWFIRPSLLFTFAVCYIHTPSVTLCISVSLVVTLVFVVEWYHCLCVYLEPRCVPSLTVECNTLPRRCRWTRLHCEHSDNTNRVRNNKS